MSVRVVRVLLTPAVDDVIVAEVHKGVVRDLTTALGVEPSNVFLLCPKTTESVFWVVDLSSTEGVNDRLEAEILGIIVAQFSATFGISSPDT